VGFTSFSSQGSKELNHNFTRSMAARGWSWLFNHGFFRQVCEAQGAVSRGLLEAYVLTLPREIYQEFFTVTRSGQDEFWHRWKKFYGVSLRRVGGVKQYVPGDYKERVANYNGCTWVVQVMDTRVNQGFKKRVRLLYIKWRAEQIQKKDFGAKPKREDVMSWVMEAWHEFPGMIT